MSVLNLLRKLARGSEESAMSGEDRSYPGDMSIHPEVAGFHDPETGTMQAVTKYGRPSIIYLCREEREV